MKKLSSVVLLIVVCSVFLVGCGGSSEPEQGANESKPVETVKLKFSEINSPVSNNALFTNKFAELVKEKTDGRVEIEVYMGGTLSGYDIEACRNGIADITQMVPSVLFDLEPSISILDAPYVYKDLDHLLKVVNPRSPVLAEINEKLASKNVRILGGYNLGRRQLTANKAVYKPSDLKGMKIRVVPSIIYDALWTALGATPTPMSFSEVSTSLLTNVIDGQENPYPTIYNNKFHEVQDYVIETDHLWTLAGIFINEKSFQKIAEEDRELLYDAFTEAADWISRDVEEQSIVAKQDIINAGKAKLITEAEGLDLKEFEEIGRTVSEQFKSEWGELYNKIIELGE